MAKKDDSQPSRVYKASDVHKRRVDCKVRTGDSASAPALQPSESVVLTPDFGRRTEQQKAADDRWFASLREDAPESVPSPASRAASPENVTAHGGRGTQEEPPHDPVTHDRRRTSEALDGAAAHGGHETGEAFRDPATHGGRGMRGKFGRSALRAPAEQGIAAGQSQGQPEPGFDSQSTGEMAPVPEAPDMSPQGDGSSEDPSEPRAPGPRASKRRPSLAGIAAGVSARKRVVIGVTVIVVVLVAVAVALFAWNRWHRFDDRVDLQGEWYVAGTTTPVAIGEDAITLTDDVVYRYEVDPQDKTIRYTFGPMKGQGRYWFSDDRRYLVITDGDGYTSAGTAVDDLLHEFSDLMDRATGAGFQLPEGEGIIAFSRAPGFGALVHDRAEAAVTAAKEEVVRKAAEEEAARQAAAEAAEREGRYYEEEPYEEEVPAEEPLDGEDNG